MLPSLSPFFFQRGREGATKQKGQELKKIKKRCEPASFKERSANLQILKKEVGSHLFIFFFLLRTKGY
jgi:hypothetical protein